MALGIENMKYYDIMYIHLFFFLQCKGISINIYNLKPYVAERRIIYYGKFKIHPITLDELYKCSSFCDDTSPDSKLARLIQTGERQGFVYVCDLTDDKFRMKKEI